MKMYMSCNLLIYISLLVLVNVNISVTLESSSRSESQSRLSAELYHVKHPPTRTCSKFSPEVFFHNIADPSITVLYNRARGLFGILMDQIESSIGATDDSDTIEKTHKQWDFITETVTSSLDSATKRLESEWVHYIILSETQELPWEINIKLPLLHEALHRIEYGYLMMDAVIRAGVKEIVGTLQHQLVDVIRKLEAEVSEFSTADSEMTGVKLLQQMKRGLSNMKPCFTTKLLGKVVEKALPKTPGESGSSVGSERNFVSEVLDQMAVVLHAFREKGTHYPNFWGEMAKIFLSELDGTFDEENVSRKVSEFIEELVRDQEKLIRLIIQLIIRKSSSLA